MTTPEAEAIPFEPLDLRGERLLVLAPHPDDEVIGCGGLVALHLREGRPVHVVVCTDGAQAGDGAQREAESRTALAMLGDATIEFLRFPDRELENAGELDARHAAATAGRIRRGVLDDDASVAADDAVQRVARGDGSATNRCRSRTAAGQRRGANEGSSGAAGGGDRIDPRYRLSGRDCGRQR